MADDEAETGVGDPLSNGADTSPQIGMLAQYVKDLSFENPNAPGIYQAQEAPQIEVQFNIAANPAGDDLHEVVMQIEVRARIGDRTAFAVDLSYAGLFGVRNVELDQLRPFLYAEAPRLMFPFARRIVAEQVRDGNFPPLLLDPLDFGAMYASQVAQVETLAASEPQGEA